MIALGEGGVRESVQTGVTGAFYERNDAAALAEAVLGFDALAVDPSACTAAAERFSVQRFQARLASIVDEATSGQRPPRPGERSVLQAGLLNGTRRAGQAPAGKPGLSRRLRSSDICWDERRAAFRGFEGRDHRADQD